MKNIVILISGRGSNMEAIVRACAAERWPARIAAVVSNRADAPGLAFAASQGIATAVVEHGGYADREAFDAALAQTVDRFSPDLVVLAGFMRILRPGFINSFPQGIINLHPSLLPSFPGLDGIGQAWRRGVKITGCTVHFVTAEVDGGPIIDQEPVRIDPADTLESLEQKVHRAEHALLPAVIARLSENR
jgi:phosphoribosylglycinamide formyltransferase-1